MLRSRISLGPLEADVVHPSGLPDRDIGVWRALQASTPEFSSPLLGPDFALAVGEVRDDARVAVFRRGGDPIGFLPFHMRPGGLARPIGGPFSDYHALITGPGDALDAGRALQTIGLKGFRFSGLIDPQGVFAHARQSQTMAWRITPPAGAARHVTEAMASSHNRARNFRRYRNRLQRRFGGLRLEAPNADAAAFSQTLDWKREQLARTGAFDVLRPAWTRELMRRLFARREGEFQGVLVSLYAGETHLCSQFGVRLGGHFHPWIGASGEDFQSFSPGSVHQWMAIGAMDRLKLATYDLGPGFDHWKQLFAPTGTEVAQGVAMAATDAPLNGIRAMFWSAPQSDDRAATSRLRRRLDQIATAELSLGGRVRGLIQAVAGYEKRRLSRPEARLAHTTRGT